VVTRREKRLMTDRYIRQDDVVFDTISGLEWKAEAAERMTWDKAIEYAESLGNNWKLPTIEELTTLIDYSRIAPATTFPSHESNHFWSSSVYAGSTGSAWIVAFAYGYAVSYAKHNTNRVRCVRRGPQRFDSLAEAEARVDKLEDEVEQLRKLV